MPLSNLLRAAADTCRYCGNKASLLNRNHPDCRRARQAGWQEMVNLADADARTHNFNEKSLRHAAAEIAKNSYGDGVTVNQPLEEGWKRGIAHSMADGIMTQTEETRLREYRDRLALANSDADRQAAAQLEKASTPIGLPWTPGSRPWPRATPKPT